jgi:hypothetical protein
MEMTLPILVFMPFERMSTGSVLPRGEMCYSRAGVPLAIQHFLEGTAFSGRDSWFEGHIG